MPAGILADRRNVAAPFYVFSHSLVKLLVERAGMDSVLRMARARRFARELQRATGKNSTGWRAAWLRELRGSRGQCPPDRGYFSS